ncbi:hypothetical protein [Sphingomonas sp. LY160]|uniref:hypothetical protein n=1 Tax=Sphingomonas sp. LY160 TaxID=3095342 RepID=UPI002ADEDBB8|nr:hypothetical protein [Sphingomonas sp. LY160]MEA1071776.1 hypothetical protein [Sphingomonas sp. LY160]
MFFERSTAPAIGIGREDLKASADVLRREEMRCGDLQPAQRRTTRIGAGIHGNSFQLTARKASGKIGKRRTDRISRLRGMIHRRHSHVPVRAVVGRVFSTRQWNYPLLDARGSLAIALHTKARDPRASSWCSSVKPATEDPQMPGAEIIIGVQPQTRQRVGQNIRG